MNDDREQGVEDDIGDLIDEDGDKDGMRVIR